MKTHELDAIAALKTVAEKSFRTLVLTETDKEKCSAVVALNSYVELHLLIINMLKVSVAALDADNHGVTNMEGTPFAVKNGLEFAMQLVPLDEAYLLDEVFGMVMRDSSI